MNSTRALMSGLIDYAGLFPPAGLDMGSAVRNYAAYLAGGDAAWLGKFIVTAQRLEELTASVAELPQSRASAAAWHLSVLIGPDFRADLDLLRKTAPLLEAQRILVDAVELKLTTSDTIREAMRRDGKSLAAFVEIPLGRSLKDNVRLIAGIGARAKIRTGGVTPDAIPNPADVLSFLRACHSADVAFKATAGLHHPLRAPYPLTYEAGSPKATMFGFLNVFLAATLLRAAADDEAVLALLEERDSSAIRLSDSAIEWRDFRITVEQLRDARSHFALSFGSCSFREPVDELKEMAQSAVPI